MIVCEKTSLEKSRQIVDMREMICVAVGILRRYRHKMLLISTGGGCCCARLFGDCRDRAINMVVAGSISKAGTETLDLHPCKGGQTRS